jgi:hypothetical protein
MGNPLTKEEFCRRFVAHMLSIAGDEFPDGSSIREYAEDTAPSYWVDQHRSGETPEDCAEADRDYWDYWE